MLSEKKTTLERTSYTFFQLMADLGGFNSAIVLFPSVLMGFFSEAMYKHSVAQEVPIRKPKRAKKLYDHAKYGYPNLHSKNTPTLLEET